MAEKVEVVITGKDELSNVLGGISSTIGGLGKVALGVAAGGLAVLGAGVVGLGSFLADSVGEAMDAQNVITQLNQVLESTGGVAGITADQVQKMAGELQKVTRFSDEAIKGGQNLLLTFTNIGKDVFPQATEIMLDMSQALGQDLKGSAVQLGKALQDPIMGVTALRRVGVNFTEAQQDVIKSLVETGKLEEAQKMILQELQKEFGGSAKAAGETFAGKLDILKNQLSEVKERIGNALLPALTKLSGMLLEKLSDPRVQAFIETLATKIEQLGDVFSRIVDRIAASGNLMDVFKVFEDGSSSISAVLEIFGMPTDQAEQWGVKIRDMAIMVQEGFQKVADFVTTNWETIKAVLLSIGAVLAAAGIASAIIGIGTAIASLANPVGLIVAAVALLTAAWVGNWGGIQEKVMGAWAVIQPVLQTLWEWLQTNIPAALQALSGFWTGTLLPAIQAVWGFISTNVLPLLRSVADVVDSVLGLAFRAFVGYIQNVTMPALNKLWDLFQTYIMPVIEKLAGFLKQQLQPAFSGVSSAIQQVTGWLSDLAGKIDSIQLPWWLTPGSPTPFELGLRGISKAMGELSTTPMLKGLDGLNEPSILSSSSLGVGGMIPAAGGSQPSISVTLEINSPVAIVDEERARSVILPYILDGFKQLQAKGSI